MELSIKQVTNGFIVANMETGDLVIFKKPQEVAKFVKDIMIPNVTDTDATE